MAVKVYGWTMSPRALLALEEAGADYELVPMSHQAGDHRRPEHLARNPFGQVPVLEDGELTLFESRAMHVLRKHKPELLGSGSLDQAAMVDVWLEVEAHQLSPVAIPIVVECIFASTFLGRERNQAVVDKNVEKLKKVLVVYEARLSQSKYLAGDFLSLADLSHFTIMHYFMATEYAALVEALPHVNAWWEGLAARPSAKKVVEFMSVGAAEAPVSITTSGEHDVVTSHTGDVEPDQSVVTTHMSKTEPRRSVRARRDNMRISGYEWA